MKLEGSRRVVDELVTPTPAAKVFKSIAGFGSADLMRYYQRKGRLLSVRTSTGLRLFHKAHVIALAEELRRRREGQHGAR